MQKDSTSALLTVGVGCGIVLLVLALVTGISAFTGWIFMLLWNFAVAPTFGLPVLNFYLAWAIWFLVGLVSAKFRSTLSSTKKEKVVVRGY